MWVVNYAVLAAFISCCGADGIISEHTSNATNQFSLDFLKVLLQENAGNVVSSPVGVYTLLGILQQGAGGNSREEINNVLHIQPEQTREAWANLTTKYQSYKERNIDIYFSNRAFINTRFEVNSDFKESLVNDFKSDIDLVDFSSPENASEIINSWVKTSTRDRITSLFNPNDVPVSTLLVIVNAIYFKNFWQNRFHTTENRAFSRQPGEDVQVPTMLQQEIYNAAEDQDVGAKFLHLDFKRIHDFTVLLVLPTERHGLGSLVDRLTADHLMNFFRYTGLRNVTLAIPKFRLSSDTELIPLLTKLGVNEVFNNRANLTGIATLPLHVGKFLQKAEIAADEGGVTASAATGFRAQFRSGRGYNTEVEHMEFIADQPFLFFIVDRVNALPLFAGRVSSPSTSWT